MLALRLAPLALAASLCSATLVAQAPGGGMGGQMPPAPTGQLDPAKAADSLIAAAETDFIRLLEAMPADKYAFAPSAGLFKSPDSVAFAGTRTFAQLVTHTVQQNFSQWANASGLKPEIDIQSIGSMTAKDDIVAAAKASIAFGHKAAATLTPANAFDAVRSRPAMPLTRITGMAYGVIHLRDEYGQMVEYARMNGVVPPASEGRPAANPSNK
jgi:hypothetical protein